MNRYSLKIAIGLAFAALSSAAATDFFTSQPSVLEPGTTSAAIPDNTNTTTPLADDCCCQRSGWFAGGDYRLVRTHFSEATAFATLSAGAGPQGPALSVTGTDVRFNYQ